MEFAFTKDQRLFQESFRDMLQAECPPTMVREAWENDTGRAPGLWSKLAGLGLTGMLVDPEHGGLGMDELDFILLLEESGRFALPEPLLGAAFIAPPLIRALASEDQARRWLPAMASGDLVPAVGLDFSRKVQDAGTADLLIMQKGSEFHALERSDYSVEAQASVDRSRMVCHVSWAPGPKTLLLRDTDVLIHSAAAFNRGALGTSAQLIGLARHLIDMTVEYAGARTQFGVPIGSFQAVKHQLADAHLAVEFARPMVYRAAWSMARDKGDTETHVSMAKVYAAEAALKTAKAALQIHGAIGYSFEHDLHLWMKRVWALASDWGDAAWHRQRVGQAVLG